MCVCVGGGVEVKLGTEKVSRSASQSMNDVDGGGQHNIMQYMPRTQTKIDDFS